MAATRKKQLLAAPRPGPPPGPGPTSPKMPAHRRHLEMAWPGRHRQMGLAATPRMPRADHGGRGKAPARPLSWPGAANAGAAHEVSRRRSSPLWRRTGLTGWRSGYELSVSHSTPRAATSGEVEALAAGRVASTDRHMPFNAVQGRRVSGLKRPGQSPAPGTWHEPDPGTWP
jgi:hypothetical protein